MGWILSMRSGAYFWRFSHFPLSRAGIPFTPLAGSGVADPLPNESGMRRRLHQLRIGRFVGQIREQFDLGAYPALSEELRDYPKRWFDWAFSR